MADKESNDTGRKNESQQLLPVLKNFCPEAGEDLEHSHKRLSTDDLDPSPDGIGALQLSDKPIQCSEVLQLDKLRDDFKEVQQAEKALQECEKGESKDRNVCIEPGRETCHQESLVYQEKYMQLAENGKVIQEEYETKIRELEEKLEETELKVSQNDAEHKTHMHNARQEHEKIVTELKESIETKAKECFEMDWALKKEEQRLTELKERHEQDTKKLDVIRGKLASREQRVMLQRAEIEHLEKNVAELRDGSAVYHMILDNKRHAKEQLGRCHHINQMVSLLPNATREEKEKMSDEISKEISNMKTSSINKRAISCPSSSTKHKNPRTKH